MVLYQIPSLNKIIIKYFISRAKAMTRFLPLAPLKKFLEIFSQKYKVRILIFFKTLKMGNDIKLFFK